ncbi:rhodanese-like domain-containing protein [Acidovorax carolinensis]|nr:rhodanese-like domain-containing protein [Acidovorax carolinensis]
MSTRTFVIFNLAGSALWAGSGIALGIIFHRQIQSLLTVLGELGNAALVVVAMALGLYIALRLYRRLRLSRIKARLPQMLPAELAQRMREGAPVVVLDVRAVGAGLVLSEGIAGALRIDIAALERDCPMDWPTDALVVTYCACPNDASAVKAAQSLNKRGRKAHVLNGGIEGWVRAGLPLEAVQSVD